MKLFSLSVLSLQLISCNFRSSVYAGNCAVCYKHQQHAHVQRDIINYQLLSQV